MNLIVCLFVKRLMKMVSFHLPILGHTPLHPGSQLTGTGPGTSMCWHLSGVTMTYAGPAQYDMPTSHLEPLVLVMS